MRGKRKGTDQKSAPFWHFLANFFDIRQNTRTFAPSNKKSHTAMTKKNILKIIVSVLIAALTALGAALGLNSCNVVRTITNKSEFYQRGDTSVMIQTKTTESYDATKKL